MYLTSFDKTRIWYHYKKAKKKNAPVLVFIHGWINNWTSWEKEIHFFEKKGFGILAFDLRGHGKSEAPEKKEAYTLAAFAKDIERIRKKEKIKEIVLIGHSMGGMIALQYQKSFGKNVAALILCDTTYKNVFEESTFKLFSPFVRLVMDFILKNTWLLKTHFSHIKEIDLTRIKKTAPDYDTADYAYQCLSETPMTAVFACLEAMMDFDATKELKKIKKPVLLIHGDRDQTIPLIDTVKMYESIQSAALYFVPNGKHCVELDDPRKIDHVILTFLQKQKLC